MAEAIVELGALTQPLFVFGGPYSNIQATEAILTLAANEGYDPHQIVCTGDIVAYCGNPQETLAAIRSSGIHVVMGNCEESLGFERDDCGCGFSADSACDVLSRQWFEYARVRLSDDDRAWMRQLPRQITFSMMGRRMAIIHGGVQDISGWFFASSPEQEKSKELDTMACDGVIAGHCGLPFAQVSNANQLWFNAGVIGMPANDGTPRCWYGIVEAGRNGGIDVNLRSFSYDSAGAANAIRVAHLAGEYAETLETGLWPNMDVLPETERALRGVPVSETALQWPSTGEPRKLP